ncbi:MAG: class I SAM-dependent methyltransferase [Gammaproteobacteria bacterium]|nr:class I SAM-dependent methyltransferase [Gammaproteobacteria bacterium]
MTDKKSHWESVYREKSPLEKSWYEDTPELSLQLIHNTQINHGQAIIDIGGGSSTLVDHLYDEGYTNISVLDISSTALAYTRNRLGDKANTIQWYEDDITLFKPAQTFSVWHDRAVFHFLTEMSDRNKYVDILKQALEPGGHLIIAAFAIGGPTKCSNLDIVQYDAGKLINELGEGFELVEEINDIHITPANKQQEFAYFRFIRK